MIHAVEERLDVRLRHPPHLTGVSQTIKGSDRLVRSSTRPETVRAVPEVLLIHGFQHFADRALYDLVLQARHAQGTHLPVRLGDVGPANRLVPIPSGLQSLV